MNAPRIPTQYERSTEITTFDKVDLGESFIYRWAVYTKFGPGKALHLETMRTVPILDEARVEVARP